MSLTSAMLVGFTGIQSNQTTVETVGNNIANVGTTAFKAQRALFETMMVRTVKEGQAPGDVLGGTLPMQIGYGSSVSAIQRNHAGGSLRSTGFAGDLAIDGRGFFILATANGDPVYTRDGAFNLDASQTLVDTSGAPVQGFGVAADGTIQEGTLGNIVIPIGSASSAAATSNVIMEGRLDGAATVATAGAVVVSDALLIAGGVAAGGTTALTDLVDSVGAPLFATGDTVLINARKGGLAMSESTFVVGTDGTTLGDFAGFLESALGINTDAATGGTPGVTIAAGPGPGAGALVINSNLGQQNAIELDAGSIVNTGAIGGSPFAFTTVTPAVGAGATTSFGVYDSLGNTADVRLRTAVESRSDTQTTWRFYAESVGDSDASPVVGTGTITFDANGQFVSATGNTISIDRAGVGTATPLSVTLDFSRLSGLAGVDGESELTMADQDGVGPGILIDYRIGADGVITGQYSNQRTQVFGQVALATFANEQGLNQLSQNRFTVGPNSGTATVVAPAQGSAGSIVSGHLESSNVEIVREFVDLLTASIGVSSSSRVIRTADELLQELLLLGR